MWHSIYPVTAEHDPIIIEGENTTNMVMLNSGPSIIEAKIWCHWTKLVSSECVNKEVPDFKLELRPGDQRLLTGSFIRIGLKEKAGSIGKPQFAAVAVRIVKS